MFRGIDISKHNGKPNFDQIKADGIQFVMIRCGFGSDIVAYDDPEFERNVAECKRVGLDWGVYFYSYALNVEQVKREIAHIRRLLKGKNPTYPVVFDMEDADGYKRIHGFPSNSVLVDICDTFLSAMEADGHYAVLYASKYWLETHLDSPKLDRYDKWVAQWTDKCTYAKPYGMWQYADNGSVAGVGKVDMNVALYDYKSIIAKMHKPTTPVHTPTPAHKPVHAPTPAKPVVKKITHKVVAGENLTVIAKHYKTTVAALVKLNGIKDKNLIYAGQVLKIN